MSDLRVWHFFCLYVNKHQLKLINRESKKYTYYAKRYYWGYNREHFPYH